MAGRNDEGAAPGVAERDAYRAAAQHLRLADRLQELAMAHIRRRVVRLLKERGASRVLDLACGTAPLSRMLAGAGLQPASLDLSPTMLALAVERGRRPPTFPVVLGDASRLPFRAGFDAAVVSLALHEMDAGLREAVWAEMRRVVRPGGWLVVVDFTLPRGGGVLARRAQAVIRFLEASVGWIHAPHYAGYRDFMAKGGLTGFLSAHGAAPEEEHPFYWGNIGVAMVQSTVP